jgi:hypothetical protein
MSLPKFSLRAGCERDMALVYQTWMRSDRCSRAGHLNRYVYDAEQRKTIDSILSRGTTMVIIAHDPLDDDAILGWACVEPDIAPPIAHYVYVKRDVRQCGIARALLSRHGLPSVVCHYTHVPLRGFGAAPPRLWVYNQARGYR